MHIRYNMKREELSYIRLHVFVGSGLFKKAFFNYKCAKDSNIYLGVLIFVV